MVLKQYLVEQYDEEAVRVFDPSCLTTAMYIQPLQGVGMCPYAG